MLHYYKLNIEINCDRSRKKITYFLAPCTTSEETRTKIREINLKFPKTCKIDIYPTIQLITTLTHHHAIIQDKSHI